MSVSYRCDNAACGRTAPAEMDEDGLPQLPAGWRPTLGRTTARGCVLLHGCSDECRRAIDEATGRKEG